MQYAILGTGNDLELVAWQNMEETELDVFYSDPDAITWYDDDSMEVIGSCTLDENTVHGLICDKWNLDSIDVMRNMRLTCYAFC